MIVFIVIGLCFLTGSCFNFGSSPVTPLDSTADTDDDAVPETDADPDEDISLLCGNGFLDPGEECDDGNNVDGDGCDGNCTYSCRADNDCDDGIPCTDNLCDLVAHQCTFPVSAAGTLCRPPAGSCDIEERCDGGSTACPADLFDDPAKVCREAAGECDVAESCSGLSGRCPTDTFAPAGQDCNDGQICTRNDACDGNGHCTGSRIERLFDVASICSGNYNTCALLGSGEIRCWGLNNHGQLGDGTMMNRITPVAVAGLPGAAQSISCGNFHTCAVLSTGEITCWGYNVMGQLGDGTTTDSTTPVETTGLPSSALSVSAGGYHTCALLSTGGVMCWGQNSFGELGNGSTTDSPVPVQVSGLDSEVASAAAGGYHSCATLTSDGTPRCWGQNTSGQIGDGSLANRLTPVNVSMPGGATAALLVLGRVHSCTVTTAGEMMCWGENSDGQLGDGSTTGRSTPVPVLGPTIDAVTMSLGFHHTCSVMLSNEAYCWGSNDYGQLGDGTTTGSPVPVMVAGLGSASSSVAIGYYHTCALLASRELNCWGQNNYGQLGNGTMLNSAVPVPVSCQ